MNHFPSAPATRLVRRLRASCALAALLAVAGAPGIAQGQAFRGNAEVIRGAAEISNGSRTTDIAVFSREVVINWTPDDVVYGNASFPALGANAPFFAFAGRAGGAGNVVPYTQQGPIFASGSSTTFQPGNSTATFTGSGEAAGGFTVLNRLLFPGRVAFNGTVQSFVGNEVGGNVWFYSPGGIVIGSNAVFNVGGLVLTTNDIDHANGLFGGAGEIRFRGTVGSTAAIEVRPGARIQAGGGGDAYVALVAPRIVQGGTVRSAGSVGLVAAEQADITINAGLLDIVVTQGTGDANGIVHMGTTGGTVSGAAQRVSMVAIPKNDAMTMLLSGTVGYEPAAQVVTDGSTIVLTAGRGGDQGSILVGNALFHSAVEARAANAIEIAPAVRGRTEFRGDAALSAERAIGLTAVEGARITALSSLDLQAQGGTVGLSALAGTEQVPGAGRIAVSGTLGIDVGAAPRGGSVVIGANGGTISAGRLAIDATGTGREDQDGIGGTIAIAAANGGTIAAEALDAVADGLAFGADGIGGSVVLRDTGGTLGLGTVTVSAIGAGGNAAGGTAAIELARSQAWGDLVLDTAALGGGANTTTGGRIAMAIAPDAALTLAGDFSARSTGRIAADGPGFRLDAPAGRFAVAGFAEIQSVGDVALNLGAAGAFDVGETLAIATAGRLTSAGHVAAAGSVSITADLGIDMTDLRSGGSTLLRAVAGPISISRDLLSAGPVTVRGLSVSLVSSVPLRFAGIEATGGDLALRTVGDLDLAAIDASGNVLVGTTGDIRTGMVRGNRVTLDAGGSLAANGDLAAADALRLRAGGDIALNAGASGANVTLESADIAIGSAGRITAPGAITLANTRAGATTAIGGVGRAGAYSLDTAEAGRLFAGQAITVTAPGDVTIGDLALAFGPQGNLAAGGTLRVTSPGRVAVEGRVTLAATSAADSLAIDALHIDVVPATGRLVLRSAAGALQGRLVLAADTITAASPELAAMIGQGAIPVAIDALLGRPAAVSDDAGYLQAGQIDATVGTGMFVQNSGTGTAYTARRGFSANVLSIRARSAGALIVINGTTAGPEGTVLTGLDTLRGVSLNGAVHPLSSVNGCFVGRNCRVLPADIAPPHRSVRSPLDYRRNLDLSRGGGSEGGGLGGGTTIGESLDRTDGVSVLDRNEALTIDDLAIPVEFQSLPYLMYFQPLDPARQEPLIDEPTTGVGNDDLWQAEEKR